MRQRNYGLLMIDLSRAAVKFAKPPLVEVVCGIQFQSVQPVRSAHFGSYWERIKGEFPVADDAPPILNAAPMFEAMTLPPLRRAWFLSADGHYIVQVQNDRFIFNWKRDYKSDAPYPSFEVVYESFRRHLAGFLDFASATLGGVKVVGMDLTYVNMIHDGNGLNRNAPWEALAIERSNQGRLSLPAPTEFGWSEGHEIHELPGHFRVTANTTSLSGQSGEKVLRVELSAQRQGVFDVVEERDEWFSRAHFCITNGFVDVSSDDLQQRLWERTA